MSTNGILDFQGTNKATFVGENSNVVIDTVNASFGIGIDVNGPTSNLHVVGNAYVSTNLEVGTANLFVDTVNSRVGIGTTSPKKELHVYGDGTATDILIGEDTALDKTSLIRYKQGDGSATGVLQFGHWGDSFGTNPKTLCIKSGGNVGIGTSDPKIKLHLYDTTTEPTIAIQHLTSNENNTSTNVLGNLCLHRSHRSGIGNQVGIRSIRRANTWDDQADMEFYVRNGGYGEQTAMVINSGGSLNSAKIGIGTTDPDASLEVFNNTLGSTPGNSTDILKFGGDSNGAGALLLTAERLSSGSNWASAGLRLQKIVDVTKMAYVQFGSNTGDNNGELLFGTGDATERMRITSSGNVGINQISPTAKLHIKPNHTSYSNPADPAGAAGVAVYNETNSDPSITHSILSLRTGGTSGGDPFVSYDVAGEHGWSIGIDNSAGRQLRFGQSWANFTSTKAYISQNSTAQEIDFTGQHRSFIDTIAHTDYLKYEGLIVSANKNQYFDIQEEIVTGVQAIKINESLPLVSISNVAYDKCCFGVISGSEDTNDREYSQGSFVSVLKKQDGDIRAHVNSVGEGAIWVVNTNGILESGDYITTSNVAGYGQKQDSEFLANYTVAKITMDCDFNPSTQPTRIIKRELRDVNYWVKYTYDDISEEEYTRVTNLGRRVRIIESGTEISQEEYENHLKKEGYTETENNTYIRNETTHQRVFSDKKMEPTDGFNLEVRNEPVNVLDEHGQIQWEDDPSGATEKAYKIRYLDAGGNITDEANAVHIAAFVGCTYHCG